VSWATDAADTELASAHRRLALSGKISGPPGYRMRQSRAPSAPAWSGPS